MAAFASNASLELSEACSLRCASVQEFMSQHGFNGIPDFLGASLPYFTTHMELVRPLHV